MFDINGISVDFATYSLITALLAQGTKATITRGQGGECDNCGDQAGYVQLHQVEAWLDVWQPNCIQVAGHDGWAKIKTTCRPCPVCNSEKSQQLSAQLWQASGLTVDELSWGLAFFGDDPGKAEALRLAQAIHKKLPQAKGFHTLYGDYGMGKSGIAKSLVAHQVRLGAVGMYRLAADLLAEVKATYGNDAPMSELEVLDQYREAALLVVDEFDRASSTEWAMSVIFSLLDHRYNSRKDRCTIVITNRDPTNLPPAYGYLADRMKDGYRILVGGQKLRGAKEAAGG